MIFRKLFAAAKSGVATQKTARAAGSDDARFGTGLWRQHRDRCMRVIDRFYETAVGLHAEAPQAAAGFVELTHELRDLAQVIDALTQQLHERAPVDGMIVPAAVRAQVGQAPELLSKAGGKIAEAAQVAAMFRAQARAAGLDPKVQKAQVQDAQIRDAQVQDARAAAAEAQDDQVDQPAAATAAGQDGGPQGGADPRAAAGASAAEKAARFIADARDLLEGISAAPPRG